MTEEAIKKFIKSYSELKARRDILDKIQHFSHSEENNKVYSKLIIKIQIIESALEILKEDERKIISWHLIDAKTWTEIEDSYEKQVGTAYNYSDRTLKRIQQNALKKIEAFLSKGEFKEYIN